MWKIIELLPVVNKSKTKCTLKFAPACEFLNQYLIMMKKHSFKKFYFFFSSIFIFILHIPFVFAKGKPFIAMHPEANKQQAFVPQASPLLITPVSTGNIAGSIYDSLRLNLMGLSQQAFQCAMQGFDYLLKAGKITNDKIISIVDFSQPSYKKRLFVIDLEKYKVVFNTYVAHGVNSGKEYADQFSNRPVRVGPRSGF